MGKDNKIIIISSLTLPVGKIISSGSASRFKLNFINYKNPGIQGQYIIHTGRHQPWMCGAILGEGNLFSLCRNFKFFSVKNAEKNPNICSQVNFRKEQSSHQLILFVVTVHVITHGPRNNRSPTLGFLSWSSSVYSRFILNGRMCAQCIHKLATLCNEWMVYIYIYIYIWLVNSEFYGRRSIFFNNFPYWWILFHQLVNQSVLTTNIRLWVMQ